MADFAKLWRDHGVADGDTIHLALDASGGMPDPRIVLREIAAGFDGFAELKLVLVVFDGGIRKIAVFDRGTVDDLRRLTVPGGGGTDYEAMHEAVREDAAARGIKRPKLFVYTDGYGPSLRLRKGEALDIIWVADYRWQPSLDVAETFSVGRQAFV